MKRTTLRPNSCEFWSHTHGSGFVNLTVDGGQVVSMVSVHSRGSLFYVTGLHHFPVVSV